MWTLKKQITLSMILTILLVILSGPAHVWGLTLSGTLLKSTSGIPGIDIFVYEWSLVEQSGLFLSQLAYPACLQVQIKHIGERITGIWNMFCSEAGIRQGIGHGYLYPCILRMNAKCQPQQYKAKAEP